jgi:hypothetical protein
MKKYPKVYPIPPPNHYELRLNHQIDALADKLNEVIGRLNMLNKCAHTRYGPDIEKINIHDIWEDKE